MNPGSSPPNAGTATRKSIVVAGIDVGAAKKGFHAVALEGGHFRERHLFHDPAELANWCANGIRATVIAVDAPCRWAGKAGGRPAEHALIGRGIFCFSTPTRDKADNPFYSWIRNGEQLYQALRATHPLCDAWPTRLPRYCFETFPHAITWQLRGGHADAKQKRAQRRKLLEAHSIPTAELPGLDWLDAALCALTAHLAASAGAAAVEALGEPASGLILVPKRVKSGKPLLNPG